MMNRSIAEPTTWREAVWNRMSKGMRVPRRYFRESNKEMNAEIAYNLKCLDKLERLPNKPITTKEVNIILGNVE